MSLLDDDANETVLVWPEVAGTDVDGNPTRVPASSPVTVRCRVQPLTSEETPGDPLATVYRAVSRDWPRGAASRVSWDGREWDVDGEPKRHSGSETTRHVTVLLRARAPEPL